MKKLIIALSTLFFSVNIIFATNPCIKITPMQANFVGEITISANIRTYPCTYKSEIIKVAKKGEKYQVIGKTYGYYKIKLENGQIAWIWDKAIKKIDGYILTSKDKIIVSKLINAINKLIQKKGEKYRSIYQNQLRKIAYKYKNKPRVYTILLKVSEGLTIEKANEKQVETTKQEKTTEYVETTKSDVDQKTIIFPGKYIDENKVRQAWLDWYNETRKKLNLVPYVYDSRLDKTALDWSLVSAQRDKMSHKRDLQDSYYDYKKLEQWFKNKGIVCENIHHYTFTENVGWGLFYCNKKDCTNQLIDSIKTIYDFYMAEKNKKYKAHYTSIVAKYFRKIGLGIVVKPTNKANMYKYFLTVHYCTKIK